MMIENNYVSFLEYCECMEIDNPNNYDYWDYVGFCQMNNYQYDEMYYDENLRV
jgi:hypothetical protein